MHHTLFFPTPMSIRKFFVRSRSATRLRSDNPKWICSLQYGHPNKTSRPILLRRSPQTLGDARVKKLFPPKNILSCQPTEICVHLSGSDRSEGALSKYPSNRRTAGGQISLRSASVVRVRVRPAWPESNQMKQSTENKLKAFNYERKQNASAESSAVSEFCPFPRRSVHL